VLEGDEEIKVGEREIAITVAELPELPEGYVRVVHIANPIYEENLLNNGLDYNKYAMAMSVARAYGNAKEAEFWSDDPRFSYDGAKALVMDMPGEDWRLHNSVTRHPGVIPKEKIVGWVNAKKPDGEI